MIFNNRQESNKCELEPKPNVSVIQYGSYSKILPPDHVLPLKMKMIVEKNS